MSATNITVKAKLDDVRERIGAARDERARLSKELAESKHAYETSGSDLPPQQNPDFIRAQAINRDLTRATDGFNMLKEEENFYLSQLAGQDHGIFSRSFLEDPAVLMELSSLATSRTPIGNMNLGHVMSEEQLVAKWGGGRSGRMAADEVLDYSPTGAARIASFMGVIPQLRRQLTLLDLIPTAVMENNVVPYVQEQGDFTTAEETPELAIKPGADLQLVDAEARARTVAHWLKLPRQTLNDIAGLANVVNSRLIYGVRRKLEDRIISGDGLGEHLQGILNTTGIADLTYVTGEFEADMALAAITAILVSDAMPTGVVLHPYDWQTMLTDKAAGSGEYMSSGPFGQTPRQLWGLPAVTNAAIPQGKALVGDFDIGATLLIREAPNVRVSDSDQDDFTRNRVTVLAEGRFALAIWQPAAFAVVDLNDLS